MTKGPMPMGQHGFHLENDGMAAHEVSIETFEVGTARWTADVIARIAGQASGFALVWKKNCHSHSRYIEKWDLQGCMAAAAAEHQAAATYPTDYRVPVSAIYWDFSNVWYRSQTDLIYIRSQDRLKFGPITHQICERRPTSTGTANKTRIRPERALTLLSCKRILGIPVQIHRSHLASN